MKRPDKWIKKKLHDYFAIAMHRAIAGFFINDPEVKDLLKEFEQLTHEGKYEEAQMVSIELENYITGKSEEDPDHWGTAIKGALSR